MTNAPLIEDKWRWYISSRMWRVDGSVEDIVWPGPYCLDTGLVSVEPHGVDDGVLMQAVYVTVNSCGCQQEIVISARMK